jgi:hypothetical protein
VGVCVCTRVPTHPLYISYSTVRSPSSQSHLPIGTLGISHSIPYHTIPIQSSPIPSYPVLSHLLHPKSPGSPAPRIYSSGSYSSRRLGGETLTRYIPRSHSKSRCIARRNPSHHRRACDTTGFFLIRLGLPATQRPRKSPVWSPPSTRSCRLDRYSTYT